MEGHGGTSKDVEGHVRMWGDIREHGGTWRALGMAGVGQVGSSIP